jgi:hypothetical protein
MILAGLDSFHIDSDLAWDFHAEIRRTPRHVGGVGAGHQRFGRNAAGIDASAAERLAFDHGNGSSGIDKTLRERRPCLTGSYNDGVVVLH